MTYLDIADYAVIGDLRTVALVGVNGSIDWCCLPRFDSPSLFGALLDGARGGTFQLAPVDAPRGTQRYQPRSAVLDTAFDGSGGRVVVTDFMPIVTAGPPHAPSEIHRRVRCSAGSAPIEVVLQPGFGYATRTARFERRRHGIVASDGADQAIAVATSIPLEWDVRDGAARAVAVLAAGEELTVVLRHDDDEVRPTAEYASEAALADTLRFWTDWAAGIRYDGPYHGPVERSAITLKLLCYAPSGAMVAAPTTSLPEWIGGGRNWDYRYVWLRDACFALYSFHVLGHHAEADQFMRFVRRVCRHKDQPHLQIMYGIDGRRDLPESELPHLSGYRDSRPVRIGNGAASQLQLDVYGEVLETAYVWSGLFELTEGTWQVLRELVDWVAANWERPDSGIWEVRTEAQHHVFSKVMCWVALDRGVRLASAYGFAGESERWRREADRCHADVLAHGYDAHRGAFVRAYGAADLDASALVIPMVRFLGRHDPRVISTVRAVARELTTADGMMAYRYRAPDGLEGEEGTLSICTFWLAQALAMIGDREAALAIFEGMLSRANHVGLYSEQIDPATGEFLGNFPQGLTHIALINCAHVLARLAPSTDRKADG